MTGRIPRNTRPGACALDIAGGCLGALAREGQSVLTLADGDAFAAPALGQTIAIAVHLEDVDVMGQAVQNRAGQTL